VVAVWPLVGRVEELALADRLVGRLGRGGGMVFAGPAGVGKSRLARVVAERAERQGATIRRVVGTAAARSLPLTAFASCLGPLDGGHDPTTLLHRARTALLAGTEPQRLLLVVDDAHLLDNLSATLVQHLVLRRDACIVLTVRSGEQAPEAITGLWKDEHLPRLELAPLTEEETSGLLEAALGGSVARAAGHDLWRITGGNALYLRHLVEGEVEAGRLAATGGMWRWSGRPQLSPGLAELVTARIGRLSDTQRAVVEMLAFAEPLGVTVLAGLTDTEAVEQVEALGLIRVRANGRRFEARLGHPLYGELERGRCGTMRARRLRGEVATALAATGARRADDLLRRAALHLDSDLAPDPVLLTAAAEQAFRLGEPGLAERMAAAAGPGLGARLVRANALAELGRHVEAAAELEALQSLVRSDPQRARAAHLLAVVRFWGLAQPQEARTAVEAGLAAITDAGWRRVLVASAAVMDAILGHPSPAATAALSVLAQPMPHSIGWTMACWALVTARGSTGRLDGLSEAVAALDARGLDGPPLYPRIAGIGNAWTRALRLAGLLNDAQRESQSCLERARDTHGPARPVSTVLDTQIALDRGLVRTAARGFRDARAEGLEPVWDFIALIGLTTALGMAGDAPGARAAAATMQLRRHPSVVFREPDRFLALAWAAAADGAVSDAVRWAKTAADDAAAQDAAACEVVALHTAVCFGDRTVADRLAVLAGKVDGPRASAAAAHAAALAADDGTGLDAVAADLAEMGALLYATDAAAQAAAAHSRAGLRGSAITATAAAQRLRTRCEGAATPALRALGAPQRLTDREREVVMLAAAGLANRAIAERLVVSVRTIEGHLYRASAKLGTSDRASFAQLLEGHAGVSE
jgi:DNA-binding CsgD family transcriptional regulator